MNARLFSFLCCVTSLVLGEGSALPVGDLVVQCSEAKVKGVLAATVSRVQG